MNILILSAFLSFTPAQYQVEICLAQVEYQRSRPDLSDDLSRNKDVGKPVPDISTPPDEPIKPEILTCCYVGASWCGPCRDVRLNEFPKLKKRGRRIDKFSTSKSRDIHTLDWDDKSDNEIIAQWWNKPNESLALPAYFIFKPGSNVPLRVEHGFKTADEIDALLQPVASSQAPSAVSATILDTIQQFSGTSGSFDIRPTTPIKSNLPGGTVISYSSISGRYAINNGLATLTLDQPLPKLNINELGINFGGSWENANYNQATGIINMKIPPWGSKKIKIEVLP